MKQYWVTICADCGTRGPESSTSPLAREVSAARGWQIGDQTANEGRKPDYCPQCRESHVMKNCMYSDKTGHCKATAMYEITTPKDETFYGCGRHYGAIIRDLFHSQSIDAILRIHKLREGHRRATR